MQIIIQEECIKDIIIIYIIILQVYFEDHTFMVQADDLRLSKWKCWNTETW